MGGGGNVTIEQLEKDGARILRIVEKRMKEREALISQVGVLCYS